MGTPLLLATLLVDGACGSGSSGSSEDRVQTCVEELSGPVKESNPEIADTSEAAQEVTGICELAEQRGLLDDKDAPSQDEVASLVKQQPELLIPGCKAMFRSTIARGLTPQVTSLIPGGVDTLATEYCADLAPYVDGTGIDSEAVFNAHGRHPFTAICVAQAVDGSTRDPSNPFTEADVAKLYTRVCGQLWDGGYFHFDGSLDQDAARSIITKALHDMVKAGEITPQS